IAVLMVLIRRATGRARVAIFTGGVALTAAIVVTAVLARAPLLKLLGKSSDLTHRLDIWQTVGEIALQRPAAGWGWGFWAPWAWPIPSLGDLNKIGYLSAHNAWL